MCRLSSRVTDELPETPDRAGLVRTMFGKQVVSRPSEASPTGFSWVAASPVSRPPVSDMDPVAVDRQGEKLAKMQRIAVRRESVHDARFRPFRDSTDV